jgi:hypothetical protein
MRPLIRIAFALLFLCLVTPYSFAERGSVRPVRAVSISYSDIAKLDSELTPRVAIITRICTCQILNLESSNYDHRYVVLLAEKANDGSSAAFSAARNRIRKEKKHLKQMFYDKVKVVAEMQGVGSCKSMFYQLRTADKNLQLYEILNADIH